MNLIAARDAHAGALVPADWGHVAELARTMDLEEQLACRQAGYEPADAITAMMWPAVLKYSFVAGGHVGAIFGVCARPGFHRRGAAGKKTPEGELWCFTGTYVGLAPTAWVDKFKYAINQLLGHFSALHAYIGVECQQMLRLARFVGGEIEGPLPFGPEKRMFWRYHVR